MSLIICCNIFCLWKLDSYGAVKNIDESFQIIKHHILKSLTFKDGLSEFLMAG